MRFSIYGIPQLAMSTTEVFLRLYFLVYFTQVINFTGEDGALIISASLLISAFFDPIIGKFADHYKAKNGRLTPLITISLILISLLLFLIFVPNWGQENFGIMFLLTTLYQITYSLFLIPYLAMAKSLIKNENDIINLYSWRYVWGSLGALFAVSLPFLQQFFNTTSYIPMGLAMVLLILLFGPISLYYLKEEKQISLIKKQESQNVLNELKTLMSNKPFLIYALSFTVLSVGLGLNQTLAVYYYKAGLKLSSEQVNTMLMYYMVVFSISIPLWVKFSKKQGKRNSLRVGLIVVSACTLFYPLIPQKSLLPLYALITVAALFTGVVILVDAYLSNIIDYHNFKAGVKKSNFIFSIWRILDKSARALGIYFAGIVIDFSINNENPIFTINQAFGYGVFIFVFLATSLLLIQKFNERHHKIITQYFSKKKPWLGNKIP
jgi:GPH family glycoside/pentoside/hexuronide:cation symporter